MPLTVRLLSFEGTCVVQGRGEGRYKNKEGLSHFQGIYLSCLRTNIAHCSFPSILEQNWTWMSLGPGDKPSCYHLYSCTKLVGATRNGPFSALWGVGMVVSTFELYSFIQVLTLVKTAHRPQIIMLLLALRRHRLQKCKRGLSTRQRFVNVADFLM